MNVMWLIRDGTHHWPHCHYQFARPGWARIGKEFLSKALVSSSKDLLLVWDIEGAFTGPFTSLGCGGHWSIEWFTRLIRNSQKLANEEFSVLPLCHWPSAKLTSFFCLPSIAVCNTLLQFMLIDILLLDLLGSGSVWHVSNSRDDYGCTAMAIFRIRLV